MIKKFELYESWLFKKSIDSMLDEIDELFIKYEDANGKAVPNKHDKSVYSKRERSDNLKKSLKYISEITEIINEILVKFGRSISQEDLDKVVKRFNTVEKYCGGTGWILDDYTYLRYMRDNMNSTLDILFHIKNFYELKVDVPEKRFENPLVFFKEDSGYYYIVHQSYVDKKAKEAAEKHTKEDPYGEEEWVDEK